MLEFVKIGVLARRRGGQDAIERNGYIKLDMGCLTSILRAGAGLVLGVVIFVGFLTYLILNNFSDKLLTVEFYTNTIAAEDTYNRIYDEVLVDDESNLILGEHLVGPHAEEVINLFALAIRNGITAEQIKTTMFAYPTGASDIGYML